MARPKGTGKEYQIAKLTVNQMLNLEKKVSEDVDEAYGVLADIMRDEEASATARKGCAETVIKLHSTFYDKRKGVAVRTVEEMDAADNRGEAEDNGGTPALSLKYGGNG
ncbi:hypothetical protein KAR91_53955 [Candidatus Pacearchaeota archaeon]|nr:hypothetical protein [Candidatus Pacearchaeota archaeon]